MAIERLDSTHSANPKSGISVAAKSSIPLASGVQYFSVTSITQMPKIYISLFRGDAALIGIANIAVVPLEIVLNPWMGRLSDAGVFNRYLFRDLNAWGRRAPLMFLSIPLCLLSCTLFWIGPEQLQNPVAVAFWYGVMRFLLSIGLAMHLSASNSAFTELFPSKAERVNIGVARFLCALLGGVVGVAAIGTSAISVKDPGTSAQRRRFAIYGSLTGMCWLLAAPYAFLQRRTIMTRVTNGSPCILQGMWDILRSSSGFLCFAISSHFYSAGFALVLAGLPFWFEVVMDYTPDEVETAVRVVLLAAVSVQVLALPVIAVAIKWADASKFVAVCGVFIIIIAPGFAYAESAIPGQYWRQVIIMGLFSGVPLSVLGVSWYLAECAIFGSIVDDDHVRRAEKDGVFLKSTLVPDDIPARRDGIMSSSRAAFSMSGTAWPGVLQVLLGALGYDGERFSKGERQPDAVRNLIYALFIFVVPLMFVAFAIPLIRFPLRGSRLEWVQIRYETLRAVVATPKCSLRDTAWEKPWENPFERTAESLAEGVPGFVKFPDQDPATAG